MDRSGKKITKARVVYRTLTGTNRKTRFVMVATVARFVTANPAGHQIEMSSQHHPDEIPKIRLNAPAPA
jgi:hypothetical protein